MGPGGEARVGSQRSCRSDLSRRHGEGTEIAVPSRRGEKGEPSATLRSGGDVCSEHSQTVRSRLDESPGGSMNPRIVFGLSALMSFLGSVVFARYYLWDLLITEDRRQALRQLV